MKNNVAQISNCFGCGVCALACPVKIIDVKLNKDGFYGPLIQCQDKCIECNSCIEVCAFCHEDLSSKPSDSPGCHAAWSGNEKTRQECSSGGVGFEISKMLIREGYRVCTVRYNVEQQKAEHYIVSTEEDLIPSIGSKYMQSYTVEGLSDINKNDKYLVIGTPCQIDSFRRFIKRKNREENYILLDFFCHSVPSMYAWLYYLRQTEKVVGKAQSVSWRNKEAGWHNSYAMSIKGNRGMINSQMSKGDLFYSLFFGDFCCNPACQKQCKYKYDSSSADIRIGDMWGDTYKNNERGVSALIAFTEKGMDVVSRLDGCITVEHPFEVVAEGQMRSRCGRAILSPMIMFCLRNSFPLPIVKTVLFAERALRKIKSILS